MCELNWLNNGNLLIICLRSLHEKSFYRRIECFSKIIAWIIFPEIKGVEKPSFLWKISEVTFKGDSRIPWRTDYALPDNKHLSQRAKGDMHQAADVTAVVGYDADTE